MKYVESLRENVQHESTRSIAFEMYFNEEYLQCLNDYNHIISIHSNHLEQIYKQLHDCSLSECKIAERCNHNDRRRHGFDDNSNDDSQSMNENSKIQFYTDLLNRMHFWLYHQFDVGIRMERSIIDQKENDVDDLIDDEDKRNQYFDHEFAKMKIEIYRRRDKWKKSDSKSTANTQCQKYVIQVESGEFNRVYGDGKETYIDALFEEFQQLEIPIEATAKCRKFFNDEAYDTDAIISDIIDYKHGSNILSLSNHQQFQDMIQEISDDLDGSFTLYIFFMFMVRHYFCYISKQSINSVQDFVGFTGIGIKIKKC